MVFINYNSFIGAEDIKNHRWFAEIDWRQLLEKKIPVPYKPSVKY